MKIYGDNHSGNCYKLKLLCSLLSIPHHWIDVDILNGETQTSEFLQMNPDGKIPVLVMEGGEYLAESNAILFYLAQNSHMLPEDDFQLAKVLQWQFFEQYSHEPYIAVARFIARYLGLPEDRKEEYKNKQTGGYRALDVMELRLQKGQFLVGNQCTIADISLYAYTHVADEGGFDLSQYPAVLNWLKRIQSLDGYVGMGD
ncbi:MAG: glutathione S-transferase family protein [Planctomycetota bacterium]|jgi:glutathione S-transferase